MIRELGVTSIRRENFDDLIPFVSVVGSLFVAVSLVDLTWLNRLTVAVDPRDFELSAFVSFEACTLGIALWLHPVTSKAGKTLFFLAAMLVFPFPLLLLSELILTTGRPLVDSSLAAADQWLGFDWPAYRAVIVSHPTAADILLRVYHSTALQTALLILVLGLAGQFVALSRLVITLIVCSIIVSVFGGLFPAVGAYEYYLRDDPTGIGPLLHSIRDGHAALASVADFKGAVSFPSYHTVMAIAFIRAGWINRYLRWPVLVINAVMMTGIPVHGAHYFVDMIGGAALVLAIDYLITRKLTRQAAATSSISTSTPVFETP